MNDITEVTYSINSSASGWYCYSCGGYVFTATHVCPLSLKREDKREDNNSPYKCPCCDGWGERETPSISATDGPKQTCRACSGSGIIWSWGF